MCHRFHRRRHGQDRVGIFKQKRLDLGPLRMGIAPPHFNEGLRESAIEQQVARQVGVGPNTDVEHADERAPEGLSKSNAV